MYEEIRMLFDNLRSLVVGTQAVPYITYTEDRVIAIFQALQDTINIHHTNNMNLIEEIDKIKKGKQHEF